MRKRPEAEKVRRWIKYCGVILCVLMARVWVNVQAIALEHQLKVLRVEADRLTYENGRLLMQIHQYESPSHLETIARKEYSMIPLDPAHRVGIQP